MEVPRTGSRGENRRRIGGDVLRAARLTAGVSQEVLGQRLDVRTPTISVRENSPDGVPWETWVAWSCALGLPSDWAPIRG